MHPEEFQQPTKRKTKQQLRDECLESLRNPQAKGPTTGTDLPWESVRMIGSHLGYIEIIDLWHFTIVNKAYYHAIKSDELAWKARIDHHGKTLLSF